MGPGRVGLPPQALTLRAYTRRRVMRTRALPIAIAVASLAGALLLGELGLRLAGFSFDIAPKSFEFGAPDPEFILKLRPDRDLFWVSRNYPKRLARAAEGRLDLAFLGDSCTELGTWPRRLARRLEAKNGGPAPRTANFGVSAWSSFQGLRQLQRDVLPLRPAIATFYYGWNDHWIGFGLEDREVGAALDALRPVQELRLSQLLFKSWLLYRSRERSAWPLRVELPDFRRNLREMVSRSREAGVVPVLLTAPTSIEPGSEPPYLGQRWLHDIRDMVPLHRRYADAVREVAAEEGAPLCDLAAHFEALPAGERRSTYMRSDGIHFTARGDEKLAGFLFECFVAWPEIEAALLGPVTADIQGRVDRSRERGPGRGGMNP